MEEERTEEIGEEAVVESLLGPFPDPCEILTSARLLQLFRSFKRHDSGKLSLLLQNFVDYIHAPPPLPICYSVKKISAE